jgi:hypothetical protein
LTGPLSERVLLAAAGGNRGAPLDLPLWARTIKRAVRHERLLTIKARRGVCPLFSLRFEIRYYVS